MPHFKNIYTLKYPRGRWKLSNDVGTPGVKCNKTSVIAEHSILHVDGGASILLDFHLLAK